ncbi:uncharacterized protein LOC129887853 isoform X2 [Solanum dulcamara]|uniref:uncharacterized protein LOC129887853 isoform X2 n=1 Tax=Solanum dulcamara TaxID=45834 RepID=UPI0024857D71|nr:uncharacterized protein LOC129887853 isoform X2 [Solanum dulcamara]
MKFYQKKHNTRLIQSAGRAQQLLIMIRNLMLLIREPQMLLDIDGEVVWHRAEVEHEAAGETSNYGVGQECLDRLSIALGGDTIVPIASEQLVAYMAAPEWKKHHAALIAIAQIAKGCSKVMIKDLEQVVNMIVITFQDRHPRVRRASINAIGVLATELGPYFQVHYHSRVLPVLAAAMDDFQNPEKQAHAASAVYNFIKKNCAPEILLPYLDRIVNKLLVLVQQDVNEIVQENALIALASVADLSQEHFQKYYHLVMPSLKTILVNANDEFNRLLRAQVMECISLIMMAVGKDKFGDDAKQAMEVLMYIQGSQMETDDPTTIYILKAWARFCKCLGKDFLPYMSVVMPPLLHSAQLKLDVTIYFADSESDGDDDRMQSIRIGINPSVIDEKTIACQLLCDYVDELHEDFYPWIDQATQALVPLLKLNFHEDCRIAAISALPKMLRSAKVAVEKGIAQGRNETYVKQLSDYIMPALLEALHKETDTELCLGMLRKVNKCLKISAPLLDEGQVRSIVDEIKKVLTDSFNRKLEQAERTKSEDFDAEESDLNYEEFELEEDIFHYVGKILGVLIETFKAAFLPFFDELSSYLMPMWGKDKTAEERRVAICIFDDVAEHCREAALKYYDTYVPFILEACNDESSDVRQGAAYGLAICAEYGGSVFKSLVGEAVSQLNIAIGHPNAHQPENVMAYNNAVTALGKICQFHCDSIDSSQVVLSWLNCLPMKADLTEAQAIHDQLCSMVERSEGELLIPNNQCLPKIVSVFAEVLCADEDLASEQTRSRMINLLRQLQQTLPPASLASIWSSLQPQQQIALKSILSS